MYVTIRQKRRCSRLIDPSIQNGRYPDKKQVQQKGMAIFRKEDRFAEGEKRDFKIRIKRFKKLQ